MTDSSDTTVTSHVVDRNQTFLLLIDIFPTTIWMTAYLNYFAGHFKFQPTDVSTGRLVFSFVNTAMFKNCTDYRQRRGINPWAIGLLFWRQLLVISLVFGSIPQRFEEVYEVHVNVCRLLIHFGSVSIWYLKEMSDDVEELKRRLEEQIEMIRFPHGPSYRSKEKKRYTDICVP